jgi:hypothetical protein
VTGHSLRDERRVIHPSHLMREDLEADGVHSPVLFCWECLEMTCMPCYDLAGLEAGAKLARPCEDI